MHLNPFTHNHPAGPLAKPAANPLLGEFAFGPRAFPQLQPDAAARLATAVFGTRAPASSGGNSSYTLPSTVFTNVVHLRDEKAINTDGGTFTSGAWRTRTLNTKKSDAGSLCTLASNQFTLTAGTYWCVARAPANAVDRHRTRIQNVTDGATVLEGSSSFAASVNNVSNDSWTVGRFTVAASKALEFQHVCQTSSTTVGFGVATNWASTEVYAEVWLFKEAG